MNTYNVRARVRCGKRWIKWTGTVMATDPENALARAQDGMPTLGWKRFLLVVDNVPIT